MDLKKVKGHFLTITRHRHMVIYHCFKAGIFWQGLFHDLSKYSPEEFLEGIRYYTDGKKSPNDEARKKKGCSRAWMHHKGRNKHHFEYWTDYNNDTHSMEPVKMPLKYVVEMFCDRVAASKIYGKEDYNDSYALNYYERVKKLRRLHPDTEKLIHFLLKYLAENGEEEAFAYVRGLVRAHKRKSRTKSDI
ncbi:MAG: catalase [Firmicutes bacterium]|nr:catalase [Bacillota bacterium]